MDLPVMPPVAPMLAKPVAQLPEGPFSFEPKWDGFRTIVFRDGEEVELGSRKERPLTRYFPELVAAVKTHLPARHIIDAEIVVPDPAGRRLDWDALLLRIHPAASRVALLATQTPARLVAFDLLALGDEDWTGRPFAARRAALEAALAPAAAGPPDPRHHRPRTGRRVAGAVRGRRAGRRGRQAAGWGLRARPAGVAQGQARPHRRLRGGRLPAAQAR
jgi:ATP-dependent DNA ligase